METIRAKLRRMQTQLMRTSSELAAFWRNACKLFRLTWPHYRALFTTAAIVIIVAAFIPFIESFLVGKLVKSLIDSAQTGVWTEQNTFLVIAMLIAGAIFVNANTLQYFYKVVLDKELFAFLATIIHEKVAHLDLAIHEDPKKKDLITKVQEKAMWYAAGFMQRMPYVLQNLGEVVIALLIFLHLDWRLSLALCLAALPRLIVNLRYNHKLWETETDIAETRRKFWYARSFLVELRNLTEVKLNQSVSFFVGRLSGHLKEIKNREVVQEKRYLLIQLPILAVAELATIWIVVTLARLVVTGELGVGMFTFYSGSLYSYRVAMNALIQNIGSQFRDGKFVTDMFNAFDLKTTAIVQPACPKISRVEQIREIEFDNVWFSYPGTNRWILKGINLKIQAGSTLGIVAENGTGKTTLVKLLCRLYEPSKGRILINGIDLQELDFDWWQAKVGVLLQEFAHYEHLDIETAIKLGRHDCTRGDLRAVQHAAECADASSFIEALPLKYKTTIGRVFEGGEEFSGGQYQKLAIARMFYRRPDIAIFDEPTSALDGAAEARVYDQILSSLTNCTRIVISHRLYTLQKADCIVLIKEGRIVEHGNHRELMSHAGTYAQLYRTQAKEYDA